MCLARRMRNASDQTVRRPVQLHRPVKMMCARVAPDLLRRTLLPRMMSLIIFVPRIILTCIRILITRHPLLLLLTTLLLTRTT